MLHLEIVGPQTVEWSLHQASVLMASAVSHKCGLTQKKEEHSGGSWRWSWNLQKYLDTAANQKVSKGPLFGIFTFLYFQCANIWDTCKRSHVEWHCCCFRWPPVPTPHAVFAGNIQFSDLEYFRSNDQFQFQVSKFSSHMHIKETCFPVQWNSSFAVHDRCQTVCKKYSRNIRCAKNKLYK